MDIYDMLHTERRPEPCPAVRPAFAEAPVSVLKTHHVINRRGPLHRFDDLELDTVGFIYIYRNPLDLLLSYVNFTRLEYTARHDSPAYAKGLFNEILGMRSVPSPGEWSAMTLDDLPREALDHALLAFSDRGLSLPTCFPNIPWSRHVGEWRDAARELPSVVVKYEDCLADRTAFNQMAKFFTFGPEDIQSAIGFADSTARKTSAEGTPEQRIFYNKMRAYYFQDYFSPAAVRKFCAANEEVLADNGYQSILDLQ
jgi:hypothetical protein